jgi:hypothetical protein
VNDFQHIAVDTARGPHVTLVAGIDFAGRYWATTSTAARKVEAIRTERRASVLIRGEASAGGTNAAAPTGVPGDWTLIAGRAHVVDVRRPLEALADPASLVLSGAALAHLIAGNGGQIVGYLRDAASVPADWRPASRVLVVVYEDHRLSWRDGQVAQTTGRFSRRGRLPRATRHRPLPPNGDVGRLPSTLASARGSCALGLTTPYGSVVVPAVWDPGDSTVVLPSAVLALLGARLPGPCTLTFDDSVADQPSAKSGVMLRGRAERLRVNRRNRYEQTSELVVHVDKVTAWDGFHTTTSAAS